MKNEIQITNEEEEKEERTSPKENQSLTLFWLK